MNRFASNEKHGVGAAPLTRTRGWLMGGLVAVVVMAGLTGCATAPEPTKTMAPEDLVWPLPPEEPRIGFVRALSSDEDVGASGGKGFSLKSALLGETEDEQRLKKPYGVYADPSGRVFVSDTGWGRVLVFDDKAKTFQIWGNEGAGILSRPVGIAGDAEGRIHVTDIQQARVIVYDGTGKFVNAYGGKEEMDAPAGIAIDRERGRAYVVDAKRHHVAVYDMTGRRVDTFGKRGGKPGEFNYPTNLAVGGDGRIYVMDSLNFRVQILDPSGKVVSHFGEVGDGFGRFARPKGIAVDSGGNIYVVDAAFNNFQVFDEDGKLLLFVGSSGQHPGQFILPAGAYIDGQDRIYIADQYNYRIQVFQYLKGKGGKPAS